MMMRQIKNPNIAQTFDLYTDCINFPLDRPCRYQKNDNVQCRACPNYIKISSKNADSAVRILIIKLGAMGDVLRTTFLLQGLKELYPKSRIAWLVSGKNSQVLNNNPLINQIIINDEKAAAFLLGNFFDITINLDLAPESLALAKIANTDKILGFSLNSRREIVASNDYAVEWLKMSAYDVLKKANTHTYQYWMSKIVELPKDNYEIIVPLQADLEKKAQDFLRSLNIKTNQKIIGINPGAGARWRLKKWTTAGFIEIAKHFSNKEYAILLLGGKDDENEIERILKENIKNVFSTGTDNAIADFFSLINLCDIVLCGDTMAMHAATGLKKTVFALFGPTSYAEIELYGRGKKLYSDLDCLVCYKQTCDKSPSCMDKIDAQTVIKTIEETI
ncbi:MAG: glycosyltransferase family 9 protein [Endomicrobium sp.]|jgi:heptosyltransferase-2|nr:glycosyltransferase family 9 protein [Endomicrobium sp.]